MRILTRTLLAATMLTGAALLVAKPVMAFCGFYVAKADTKLLNKASKVVIARKGNRTAVTMASDYQGDLKEFAIVIPVPTVVTKNQIAVIENATVDHLDGYTAPRLVEYFDPDPCAPIVSEEAAPKRAMPNSAAIRDRLKTRALGVKIEAAYTVGEYDILILSATQSDGLRIWLTRNGYKIPKSAGPVLGSYIKQDMKFFVAKVNLKEQDKLGNRYLRPIRVSYDTGKFMLPIRLGTVNADGPQDMIVLMLTEKGRVEATNYRTVKIPSDMEIPLFAEKEFGKFYQAMFDRQVVKDDARAVYLEYAWDMGWCDPCATDPLPNEELVKLGAFWVGSANTRGMGTNVFVTRLHVRYDAAHFPEDLVFQETADRSNFQGRYILRRPFVGEMKCPMAEDYRRSLKVRFEQQATTLASLTGWDINMIREKMRAEARNAQ